MITEEDKEKEEGRAQASIESAETQETPSGGSPAETVGIDKAPASIGEEAMKAFVQEIVGIIWTAHGREILLQKKLIENIGNVSVRDVTVSVGYFRGVDHLTCRLFQALMAHFNARMRATIGKQLIEFSRDGMAIIHEYKEDELEGRNRKDRKDSKEKEKNGEQSVEAEGDDDAIEDRGTFIV